MNIDNEWMRLDTSFNSKMSAHGFRVYDFEHAEKTCFDLTKFYTQEDALLLQEKWLSLEYVESYFNDNAKFLTCLNE